MSNLSNRVSEFFGSQSDGDNTLLSYIQSLNPEIVAQLSKPDHEVVQVMEHNIVSMLGALPPEPFDVAITTKREHLGRLLASAMMSGYFLHNAQQRLAFEKSIHLSAEANESES